MNYTEAEKTQKFLGWYSESVRPFLEQLEPERVPILDADIERLRMAVQALDDELSICFIGDSGIGKSTLVNALVAGDRVVLPSGGLGPLTAQALIVRHGDAPAFEAEYHGAKALARVLFVIERSYQEELRRQHVLPDAEPASIAQVELAEDDIQATEEEIHDGDPSSDRPAEYLRIARLLVKGSVTGNDEVAYLADSLREAMGKPREWGTASGEADATRISRLRIVLEQTRQGQPYRQSGALGAQPFLDDLSDHASGFLAPLIKDLHLMWPSPILEAGMTLVDLPGLGIAGDPYRRVTQRWVREQARAVVLVVGHRGVSEANADLLRTSGFLNRFLYANDDPTADPVLLFVAAVRLDETATELYARNRNRKKREYLAEARTSIVPMVRDQLRSQLDAAWASTGADLDDARKQVISTIIERLEVHGLSPIEYRRYLAQDDDDRPFITDTQESGVPALQDRIRELAQEHRSERESRLTTARDHLCARLLPILAVIQAQWQDQNRASEEAERLREDLSNFLEPLRAEFHVRQGAFREFLKDTLPRFIETLVVRARETARQQIRRDLQGLRDYHWATLRAAVRRNGVWDGSRHVELPRDFALRFEEPVADLWGKEVLREIRKRTKQFADDCVDLVDQVVVWSRGRGADVQARVVEAQRESIKADASRLQSVGRELVNELRESVKQQLLEAVEGPIRIKCREFVKRGDDIGPGVKRRILELFDHLADDAVDAATKPASRILTACYREIETDIRQTLEQHRDPLAAASEAIVASHAQYVRRSDAQRRRRVLDDVQNILSSNPCAGSGAAA